MSDNMSDSHSKSADQNTLQVDPGSNSRRRPSPSPARANATANISTQSTEEQDEAQDIETASSSEDEAHTSRPRLRRIGTTSKSYTTQEERTVLRKLDRRLTLFLCLLYLLSFLDRSNIGNARIAGLQSSLRITDTQFDAALIAFYVTYITFEWMILLYRLVPPHIYIASCVFSWGLVACLQASVRNFTQLLVLRALLGVTEAAFGPGVPFYMTFFYRREELAYRVGLQISAAPLAISFASSLAWVILKVSEHSRLEGWRALFLFEGFPSIVAAVFAFYLIPDSPASATWLTPRERKIATLRLRSEHASTITTTKLTSSSPSSSANVKLNPRTLLRTLVDFKAWLAALMFLSVNVSFSSLPVFLPTIINAMSFSPLASQILAAPPYLLAFAFVLVVSRASDRTPNSRAYFLASCAALSCVSYSVSATVGHLVSTGTISARGASIVIRYIAVHGAAMGLFASVVLIITWQLNNQESVEGKGVGMVILNVVGQTGPLIGVELFPERDGPYYVRGMAVCAGFMGVVFALALALRTYLGWLNWRIGDSDPAKQGEYEMVGMDGGEQGINGDEGEGEGEGLIGGSNPHDGAGGVGRKREQVFKYML